MYLAVEQFNNTHCEGPNVRFVIVGIMFDHLRRDPEGRTYAKSKASERFG